MSRRRWRYLDDGTVVEVTADDAVTPRVELQTGAHYEGAVAPDGTRIDTPRRHAEYMRRNGLALAGDFRQAWAEAPKKRAAAAQAERREAVGRAIYQLETRGRSR